MYHSSKIYNLICELPNKQTKKFSSTSEAANYFGLHKTTVTKHVRNGNPINGMIFYWEKKVTQMNISNRYVNFTFRNDDKAKNAMRHMHHKPYTIFGKEEE